MTATTEAPPKKRPSALGLPFRMAWASLIVALPLLGAWAASSIAAHKSAPMWVALLVGAGIFPLLPVLWELDALRRFRKRKLRRNAAGQKPPRRWLKRGDRLVLRTLSTSLAALALLIVVAPQAAFTALSARGDWMLDGRQGGAYDVTRQALFFCADRLEWAYKLALDNPYERYAHDDDAPDAPKPGAVKKQPKPSPAEDASEKPTTKKPDAPDAPPEKKVPDAKPNPPHGQQLRVGDALTWPPPPTVHPVVTGMPASARTSIQSVGTYIKARISDRAERVKALHDFTATHLAYDAPALLTMNIPPQDAETVFAQKKAVCAGYSLLMEALGKVTGDRIVYVVGVSRDANGEVQSGAGHAWNAVELDGGWSLMDVTWDSGSVNGSTFTRNYSTDYLFTPASIFTLGHFPDDAKWQLSDTPISRGDFIRQPPLRPAFFAHGFKLISPERGMTNVNERLIVQVDNPRRRFLSATARPQAGGVEVKCNVSGTSKIRIDCAPRKSGNYNVVLFANTQRYGTYASVGHLGFSRGP